MIREQPTKTLEDVVSPRQPPLALRVDGYVRVSQVGKRRGPRFISPDVQREAILQWATNRGVEVLHVFEELDASGAQCDRPLLEAALQRIERGLSGGLAVWRVDRFGRSLSDGVRVIERIQQAGGGFYAVQEGLDIGTEAGRLVLRILLSVAEYQREGIRASFDIARERAVRRGANQNGIVGYRKTRSGRLRPDPKTGPLVAEIFRRRAAGETLNDLCRVLEQQNVRTGKGNLGWSSSALGHMLKSRAYLGEVRSGPYVNTAAHPPLIDSGTWQKAMSPLNSRRRRTVPALLVGGHARCAGCSHALTPATIRRPDCSPYIVYSCRRTHASGPCPAPTSIAASKLDPYVVEAMLTLLRRRRKQPLTRLAAAEERAALAENVLARYRDSERIRNAIGEAAFVDGLLVRQKRLADANLDIASAQAALGIHALPPAEEVARDFPTMPLRQRRELLSRVIDCVFVLPGHRPARERVMICPVGTAPRLLPRQGDKGRNSRIITPRRGWMNPRPGERDAVPRTDV